VAWDEDPARALAGWARRLRAGAPNKLWVATVMPGGDWDDFTKTPVVRIERDRQEGAFLRRSWRGVMDTKPALVIVTSYNETFEKTGLQPAPAWGALYLDLNRQLADVWRASVGAGPYGT
jgi:hypothetical protein